MIASLTGGSELNRIEQLDLVFETLGRNLPAAGVPFLMIGGHAVNYYGYTRATIDIDFMITAEDIPAVREVMKSSGFSNISQGDSVIFFSQPESPLRVDFLPVDSGTMQQLLAESIEVPYGGARIRIPCLKDLLAMKLFALHNGPPLRREKDLSDVIQLAFENRLDCESDLKPLCDRFASDTIFSEIASHLREMNHA
jgi:hypothetical protein